MSIIGALASALALRKVTLIMNALADATMDFMAQDPANADKHCALGFDALWRVVS